MTGRAGYRRSVELGTTIKIGIGLAIALERCAASCTAAIRTQLWRRKDHGYLRPTRRSAMIWAGLLAMVARHDHLHWATKSAAARLSTQIMHAHKRAEAPQCH